MIISKEIISIPLIQIQVLTSLIPKALEISKFLNHDKERERAYSKLHEETGYLELLKVGVFRGQYVLLSNYECWRIYQKIHHKDLSIVIHCIAVTVDSEKALHEISLRLSQMEGLEEPYLGRLLTLDKLFRAGISYEDIKRMYGVENSSSPEARKLQRDLRLVKSKDLLNLVLGIDSSEEKDFFSNDFMSSIRRPGLMRKSKISYSVAQDVLKILGDDEAAIKNFIAKYEKDLCRLEALHTTPEEKTKPIYQSRNYSKTRVLTLAQAVVGGQVYTEDTGREDFIWRLNFDEITRKYTVPEISFHIDRDDPLEIKKIFEIVYGTILLSETLLAHISRIRPAVHGGSLKTRNLESNLPKLDDIRYFDLTRDHKMLRFSNRQRLLKSIGLHSGLFGFDGYQSDAHSSYATAYDKYEKWFKEKFLEDVFLYYQDKPDRHPKYKVYISIRIHLAERAADHQPIAFDDFIGELFKKIFTELDLDDKSKKDRVKAVVDLEYQMKTLSWEQIHEKMNAATGKYELSEDEIQSLLKDALHQGEERLLAASTEIARSVDKFIKNQTPSSHTKANQ